MPETWPRFDIGTYERAKEKLSEPTPGLDANIDEVKRSQGKASQVHELGNAEFQNSQADAMKWLESMDWWLWPKWASKIITDTSKPATINNPSDMNNPQTHLDSKIRSISPEEKERKEKEAIFDSLRDVRVKIGEREALLDTSKIEIIKDKNTETYTIKSSQKGFEYIQTPIKIGSDGKLIIPDGKVQLAGIPWAGRFIWLSDGAYTMNQNGKSWEIKKV